MAFTAPRPLLRAAGVFARDLPACSLRGERDVPGVPPATWLSCQPTHRAATQGPEIPVPFRIWKTQRLFCRCPGPTWCPAPSPWPGPTSTLGGSISESQAEQRKRALPWGRGLPSAPGGGWRVAVVARSPDGPGPVLRDSGPWGAALCSRGTDGWEGDSGRRVHPALCGRAFPGQTAVKIRSRYGSKLRRVIPPWRR